MTADDQATAIGRLVQEYRDTKAHKEALDVEAKRVSDLFHGLGAINPQHAPGVTVKLDGRHLKVTYASGYGAKSVEGTFPEYAEVQQLIEDRAETAVRLEKLKEQLKNVGLPM